MSDDKRLLRIFDDHGMKNIEVINKFTKDSCYGGIVLKDVKLEFSKSNDSLLITGYKIKIYNIEEFSTFHWSGPRDFFYKHELVPIDDNFKNSTTVVIFETKEELDKYLSERVFFDGCFESGEVLFPDESKFTLWQKFVMSFKDFYWADLKKFPLKKVYAVSGIYYFKNSEQRIEILLNQYIRKLKMDKEF